MMGKVLYIGGIDLTVTQWTDHFGSLQWLHSLNVGRYGAGLADALLAESATKFRALRHLVARQWYFGGDYRGQVNAERLHACLQARQKEGVSLEDIHINRCENLLLGEMEAMREVVGKLSCDFDIKDPHDESDSESDEEYGFEYSEEEDGSLDVDVDYDEDEGEDEEVEDEEESE